MYDWLKLGGKLVIHLVNKELFDPILQAADPLLLVSPQKDIAEIIKFNC